MSARHQMNVSDPTALPGRDSLYMTNDEKTFAHDELLPNLPLPSLQQTVDKYLDSVKPFVTDEEYETTLKLAEEFKNGVGKELQCKLMEKANHQRNWLEKWWLEMAYLSQRTPLLPLCSMAGFTNMDGLWLPVPGTQSERAALYVHFLLQFWRLLRKEQLRPHSSHDVPWSMHQFKTMFSTVRTPGEVMDKLECHFHTEFEDPSSPTHIIILYHGHIFTFDVIDEYGEILPPPELELQFRRIKEWCEEKGWGASVGCLTVDDRSTWAENRKKLLQIHPENELHLQTINTSLAVISLDEAEPHTTTDIVRETLAGDCSNRWADKSITNIIYKNGTFGMSSDHTPFDGLVPMVCGHYVYTSLKECGGVWKGVQTVDRDLLPPRRLEFHLNEDISTAIEESQKVYQTMVADTDVTSGTFTQYGKSFLKPYKFHPETFVQFALQLAYYTMHGRPAPTYVTATTRRFYHGRTETLRSCFSEVVEWVRAMIEDRKSMVEKLHLMQVAADKFKALMKDCMNNHGCDRHFLGLYMTSVENEIPLPDIFTDPAFMKSGGSGNFVLSTSCAGYTPLGGCVMPMREDGYGTFYNIENNRLTFTITAFNRCQETSSVKFFQHIERSLIAMQQLLLSSKL